MRILGVIPSRYASTRFEGKPLIDLKGKSMIQRVYEQCKKSQSLTDVIIATDDDRIYDHAIDFGANVIMTSTDHRTGTERCAEVVRLLDDQYDYVINIQGDEPFIHPEQIDELTKILDGQNQLATLIHPCSSSYYLFSPNTVKVVFNQQMKALYFSREPIPHIREEDKESWQDKKEHFVHIGIYAYQASLLEELIHLSQSKLEQNESLEQLRWLDHGFDIQLGLSSHSSYGIDTPEDVAPLLKRFLSES